MECGCYILVSVHLLEGQSLTRAAPHKLEVPQRHV